MPRFSTALFLIATVWMFGSPIALAQYGSTFRHPNGTPYVTTNVINADLGMVFDTFENYFGSDGGQLQAFAETAIERNAEDRFEWYKKVNGEFSSNSCGAAAENFYDAALAQGQVGENGWEVRNAGTLGSLTTLEVGLFNPANTAYDTIKFWDNRVTPPIAFNALNPPAYAHTLSIVRSPDGRYYTVDTWDDHPTFERIYPIGADATFFSNDPNANNATDATLRLTALDTRRGRAWGVPEPPGPGRRALPGACEAPPSSAVATVRVVASRDPNDKLGLLGVGENRYVTADNLFRYTIRFENVASATAPAQEVLVRDTLDASVFDLDTVELGEITFGQTRVNVPPGRSAFSTRVPLRAGLDVVISGHLVRETGVLTWRLSTVDTQTGDLPADPFDGFLPPNRNAPEGEGSVSLSVRAQAGIPSGREVRNEARIFFDVNEPIDTPPWVNVIDDLPPSSSVTELEPTQMDSVFTVRWVGSDAGAGISHYDVYVSKDGGEFYQWLRRTASPDEMFGGQVGSTYSFYSIAYDELGNAEAPKSAGEASTGIVVDAEAPAVTEFILAAPFPNPVGGLKPQTILFALPEASQVSLIVFDVRGREVDRLTDEEMTAGWHQAEWTPGAMAPGVYVIRLQAGARSLTRQVTVVR